MFVAADDDGDESFVGDDDDDGDGVVDLRADAQRAGPKFHHEAA